MFTPSTSRQRLAYDTAGSKTVAVPASMTAVRIVPVLSVNVAFNAASASAADMTVRDEEIFGVTAGQNLSVYGVAGTVCDLTFGTEA